MFNKTIPRGGDGAGRGGGGSKKCKPIPAPPRGAGLKSHPIPAPPPLRDGENPHGAKQEGAGQAGRGKIAIPTPFAQNKNEKQNHYSTQYPPQHIRKSPPR